VIGWGDAHWRGLVDRLVRQHGVEANTKFLGFLDNEEKYRAVKASRVFLFPSSNESWGIVVAEALACGLPVVAFDIPATRKFGEAAIRTLSGTPISSRTVS